MSAPVTAEETGFTIEVDGQVVPGVVWRPPARPAGGGGGGTPLVLAGHGGGFGFGGSKRADGIVSLAAMLARDYGVATVAIDQPGCGDRPGAEEEQARRKKLTVEQAIADLWTDELVTVHGREWRAAVAHVQGELGLGEGPLGYWGLSGGTTFGLPLVATDKRIEVAVLGLNSAVPLMRTYAPQVQCPVLFIQNLDDSFMSRESALQLFDELGSSDKRIHAHPGDHGAIPPDEHEDCARFLGTRLRPVAVKVG